MAKSIANKIGQGLTPQGFIDAMTKNQDKFLLWGSRLNGRMKTTGSSSNL